MQIDFVDNLPWNSFGRKNVGYLFAISQGAKIIFDFDDDNIIKFWMKVKLLYKTKENDTMDSFYFLLSRAEKF